MMSKEQGDGIGHNRLRELLSAYHDGELQAEQSAEVQSHLAECDDCRRTLGDLKRLDQLVQSQSSLGSEAYWKKSAERIERQLTAKEAAESKTTPLRPKFAAGAIWKFAAVAASVMLLTYIGLHDTEILRDTFNSEPANGSITDLPVVTGKKPDRSEATASADSAPTGAIEMPSAVESFEGVRTEGEPGIYETASQAAPKKRAVAEEEPPARPLPEILPRASGTQPIARDIRQESQTGEGRTADANYKERPKAQDVGGEEVLKVVPDGPSREDGLYGHAEVDLLVTGELAYWRGVRDSLEATSSDERLIQEQWENRTEETSVAAKGKRRNEKLAQAAAPSPELASKAETDSLAQSQLARAWFQIARLTVDSSEAAIAENWLRAHSADSLSPHRRLAIEYLEKLGL